MDDKRHIDMKQTDLTFQDLEHISSCDFCAEQFADYVEACEPLPAPKHMKDAILTRSRQLDIQLVEKSNRVSKRMELFYYSLKVCFATAFAIMFLVLQPQTPSALPPSAGLTTPFSHSVSSPLYQKAQEITGSLNALNEQLNKQLFQMEVTPHDKQKK